MGLSGSQFNKRGSGYSLSKSSGWKARKSVRYNLRPAGSVSTPKIYKKYRAK